jgi:tRNA 2-thiouridine synthesizing protein A
MTTRISTQEQQRARTETVNAQLDCKGLLCPLPIYRTAQAMSKLKGGEVLRIECTDPGSLADFPAFARQRGHALVSAEEHNGVQVFHLRKGEVP